MLLTISEPWVPYTLDRAAHVRYLRVGARGHQECERGQHGGLRGRRLSRRAQLVQQRRDAPGIALAHLPGNAQEAMLKQG